MSNFDIGNVNYKLWKYLRGRAGHRNTLSKQEWTEGKSNPWYVWGQASGDRMAEVMMIISQTLNEGKNEI